MKKYLVTYYEDIYPIHEIPIEAKDRSEAKLIAIQLAPFIYEYFEIEEKEENE